MSESPVTESPDPIETASTKIVGWGTMAVMTAEGIVSARAGRSSRQDEAAGQDDQDRTSRAERAQAAADKAKFSIMLDPRTAQAAGPVTTLQAWKAAVGHLDDERARTAADVAEARLREQAPDLMRHYDQQRIAGLGRADAMRAATLENDRERRQRRERREPGDPARPERHPDRSARSGGPAGRPGTGAAAEEPAGGRRRPAANSVHQRTWNGPVGPSGKPVIQASAAAPGTSVRARVRGLRRLVRGR